MRLIWLTCVTACGFRVPAADAVATDPVDVGSVGDAGFDVTTCPTTYAIALGSGRYRLISDGHRAWEQSDDCADDLRGGTHLAIIETVVELAAVQAFIDDPGVGLAGKRVWIGGVQRPAAQTPIADWIALDGNPLLSAWRSGDPDDGGDNSENNHQEQFVALEQGTIGMLDVMGNDNDAALCECDGKPIALVAASAISASRH